MMMLRLILLLSVSILVRSPILGDMEQADVEAVRIRLEEEKAKRLLLQNDVEVLMLQVEELKRKCNQKDKHDFHGNISLVTSSIGFTARLSLSTEHNPEQTVIFDEVLINEGHCYDSSTGRFRAPFRGLYSFSVTVLKEGNETDVRSVIMKTNIEIGRLFSGSGGFGSGSVTVLTVMDKGQMVYVKKDVGSPATIHGRHWSTFTGILHNRYD